MLPQNISRLPSMIGWPGGIGLALLGAAVVMSLTLALPAREENASLEHEIRQLEPQRNQPTSAVSASEMRTRLDDFVGTLPRHDAINDTLNRLHDLAARHHLSLKNSEYRPEPNQTGVIRQLRITIKTEGEYADLRGFLREIPQVLPSLSIGQLSLTRQKISDTKLDTVVEFALFYSNVYSQADPKRS